MAPRKKIPFPELVRGFYGPYLKLAGYLKPYKVRFVMALVFGMVSGVLNGVIPLVIKTVGDKVLPDGAGQMEVLQAAGASDGPGIESVVWITMLIPLVMVARGVCSYMSVYYMAWVSFRVLRDIRTRLFGHLISQSLDFFNKAKAGRLISRVVNDTRMAQNALVSISGDVVKNPIAVITGVCVLVYMDWRFSLTTLVLFPICMIPIAVFGKKVRQAGKAEENEAGAMAVILQESFAGVRVIKSFAREDYQTAQFAKSSDTQCRNSFRVRKSIAIVQPIIESVSAFGVVLAILYVYFFDIGVAKFIALCAGIFLLYNPVKALSKIPMLMQKCMACSTAIFDLLATRPSVVDAPGASALTACRGDITFEGVHFHYTEGTPALQDFSLAIPPGKKFALVGASGAGKTTVLSLLLRFYDPARGRILVDGRDIRSLTQKSLRENIGIVSQDTFLFHDTIYENIRYGRLDATREEIVAAATLAYAHDFILAQPEGYETVVGDKGCQLSGGQQQRLAIARALLKNAPILLLDEATSALDSESERMIHAALERLARGRSVIAIAHRLSTVLESDCIVMMQGGKILDAGPHAELLARCTAYRSLCELQFQNHESSSFPRVSANRTVAG
jgi:ATP-binding cassette, subfamily B, bacterial MsbA